MKMKFLIYGGNGWIGQQIINLLKEHTVVLGSRVENLETIENEIKQNQPDRIICCIGRTSGGNIQTIDYLEQPGKNFENVRDNLYGPILLANVSQKYNIHMTYLGTGCIFNGYKEYTEEDVPDFFGSSYSQVKGFTDILMHSYENLLNVRIRMPITSETHPRNFITKITKYEHICSMDNSMTVLDELLPVLITFIEENRTGTINLVNPGVINHNEILIMYKEIVDPNFTWKNFSLDDQNKILLAGRSNNSLSNKKLLEWAPNVSNIHDAIWKCLTNMSANLK